MGMGMGMGMEMGWDRMGWGEMVWDAEQGMGDKEQRYAKG